MQFISVDGCHGSSKTNYKPYPVDFFFFQNTLENTLENLLYAFLSIWPLPYAYILYETT